MTGPVLTTLFVALVRPGFGAEATFELSAPSTSATLGRPVPLTVTARLPREVALELDLARSTTDSFAITKAEAPPAEGDGPSTARRFELEILPLAVGPLQVPLFWTARSGASSESLASPPLAFDVAPPPSGPEGPKLIDIKEPRRARPAVWPWLLAAAVGAACWELYRRRKSKEALARASVPVDTRPAEVIALDELSMLESSGAWDQGLYKSFYLRLTDILRNYLERRYRIPATRLTTEELYRHARQAELDRALTGLFKDIFDRADLVKFAKVQPDCDWGGRDLAGARRLVEGTAPSAAEVKTAP